jgi:hypothetical protein
MRITKEMENKIKKSFDVKYEKGLSELYLAKRVAIDNIKRVVSEHIIGLCKESLYLEDFLRNQFYHNGEDIATSIAQNVFNRGNADYEISYHDDYVRIGEQIKKMEEQKYQEIDDFKIQISYSKDLKEIASIFTNFGMTF